MSDLIFVPGLGLMSGKKKSLTIPVGFYNPLPPAKSKAQKASPFTQVLSLPDPAKTTFLKSRRRRASSIMKEKHFTRSVYSSLETIFRRPLTRQKKENY